MHKYDIIEKEIKQAYVYQNTKNGTRLTSVSIGFYKIALYIVWTNDDNLFMSTTERYVCLQ